MAQCTSCESILTVLLLFLATGELHGFAYEREEPNWGAPRKIGNTGTVKFPSDNENTQFTQTRRFPLPEIPQRTNVQTFSVKDVPAMGESHGFSHGSQGPNWSTDNENTKFIQTRGFPLPDLPGRPRVQTFSMKDVPVCKNATFCEQPPFYPDELVNLAVQMDKKYKYSASVDEIEDSEDTESRIDLMDEVPVCASEVHIVYPKTAENRYSQWLFVVNNNKFAQGVRVEACRSEESNSVSNAPDGYVTVCKQQYVFRHLAAILPDGAMKMDLFRFPSGCRAYVKFSNPYDTGYFNQIN